MSEVKDFFRICPACGRRFHIKLVSKTLVDDRKEVREVPQSIAIRSSSGFRGISAPTFPVVLTENVPVTFDVESFEFSYKCGHCEHVWSEVHVEENKT
ncbi:MAG TPA: hypothetical protein VGR53_03190 [Nitrososphaerales archaeon]|nr:hypothetical protein [Nitrososphaerales archaeon]